MHPNRRSRVVNRSSGTPLRMAEIVTHQTLLPPPSGLTMGTMPSSTASRRVVIVAYPDVQCLDVTGPNEVFAMTARMAAQPYRVEVVAPEGGVVRTSSGLHIVADSDLAGCEGSIDTLVVAGGIGTGPAIADADLVAWVRDAAGRSRRVTSVCTGSLILAAAGLLDGRRATTHWEMCGTLAALHPTVDVEPDRIYVRDGHVWTSAGVTAGMDLALALVEEDHGPAVALDIARQLVLFTRRAGGQSQFSPQLAAVRTDHEPLRDVVAYVAEHLDADLSVPTLAGRAAMSPRTFARVFRAEVGTTPAAFVQASRVEAARRLLEASAMGTAAIARACGFGTVETMHRAFRRTVHTTPGRYRRAFSAAGDQISA